MEEAATIALVGNPNAGKTTLFNALTGANERVGNYSGVTVEVKSGEFFSPHGTKMRVLDLPGCYGLRAGSPDEQVAVDVLTGKSPKHAKPDLVICVLDASSLERHLLVALDVIALGLPVVVALNMVDVAEKSGLRLDPVKLSEELGVPVVPTQANAKKGVIELKQIARSPFPPAAHPTWETADGEEAAAKRRKFVHALCELAARRPTGHQMTVSDKIDRWLLHPFFGWIAFLAIILLVFWTIFSFASIPMDAIEGLFGWVGEWIGGKMPDGDLKSLVVDGAVAGVSASLVFLPQIVLLFFFIGLLESSGYMARAAYLMDGVMSFAGLSGKSFLPLMSSAACAIPGVMATRTIESPKERLVTIFVAPWISCSARLPVYFLLLPLLVAGKGASWKQAVILFSIYVLGVVSCFVVARVLRGRIDPGKVANHFLLELPPYRLPQWGYIFRHVLDRAWAFVSRAGTLILGISVILWALGTYPKFWDKAKDEEIAAKMEAVEKVGAELEELEGKLPEAEYAVRKAAHEKQAAAAEDEAADYKEKALDHSMMGRIGHAIEPVVKPLGFDWRIGTAIMTSFAARETFNTTMGVIFHVGESDDEDAVTGQLREKIAAATWPDGRPLFTTATTLSLLVFYIYALQCLATSAVVARETRSWKWAAGQFVFMTIFAYTASLLVYQSARFLS